MVVVRVRAGLTLQQMPPFSSMWKLALPMFYRLQQEAIADDLS